RDRGLRHRHGGRGADRRWADPDSEAGRAARARRGSPRVLTLGGRRPPRRARPVLSNAAAVERDPAPLLVGAEWFPDTPGRLNRTFRLLFTGLADAGLRTSAVVVGPVADAPPGVAVIAPGRLPLRMARFARTVTGLSSRANAVDVHFALYGLAAVIAARRRRRPVLVHFHGPWADE